MAAKKKPREEYAVLVYGEGGRNHEVTVDIGKYVSVSHAWGDFGEHGEGVELGVGNLDNLRALTMFLVRYINEHHKAKIKVEV